VDFSIGFVILIGLMFWYGISPTVGLFLLPFFLLIVMIAALGGGLWLTALNVKYRDVKFVVPFVIQFMMYASPVAYSTSIIPERWQWVYSLNPMVGVIEGFRWALLGRAVPSLSMLYLPVGIIIILLVSGLYYFKGMEKTFADIV
jgi:lipopolysaccharide transport system permease protein